MGWIRLTNNNGAWDMNIEGMRALAHAYCRAHLILENTRTNQAVQNFGPLGMSGFGIFNVNTTNVSIDFDTVDRCLHDRVLAWETTTRELRLDTLSNDTIAFLTEARWQAQSVTQQASKQLSDAAQANQNAFQGFDSRMAAGIAAARLTRDASISLFLIVAGAAAAPEVIAIGGAMGPAFATSGVTGAVSAGAAAGTTSGVAGIGAVAVGSAFKGGAAFQDGYHGVSSFSDGRLIGDSLLSAGGTFVTTLIPASDKWGRGVQAALILGTAGVSGAVAAGQQIVRGKDWRAATEAFASSALASSANSYIGSRLSTDDLPLNATVTMKMLGSSTAKSALDLTLPAVSNYLTDLPGSWGSSAPAPSGPLACISTNFGDVELNYITKNVFRPAAQT